MIIRTTLTSFFGDAYEFLMTMYASNAGKSRGEFFTPQEVSELLAEIVIRQNHLRIAINAIVADLEGIAV